MEEIWKTVKGYDDYLVSNKGDVISKKKSKHLILSKPKDSYGYYVVALFNGNGRKTFKVHRLVALMFIDNSFNKETVNHINGIKTDNRVENLEWCTSAENTYHANRTGLTDIKGEKNVKSVNTESIVLKLREKYKLGKYNFSQLAEEFCMNRTTVRDIIKRKTWKHI